MEVAVKVKINFVTVEKLTEIKKESTPIIMTKVNNKLGHFRYFEITYNCLYKRLKKSGAEAFSKEFLDSALLCIISAEGFKRTERLYVLDDVQILGVETDPCYVDNVRALEDQLTLTHGRVSITPEAFCTMREACSASPVDAVTGKMRSTSVSTSSPSPAELKETEMPWFDSISRERKESDTGKSLPIPIGRRTLGN